MISVCTNFIQQCCCWSADSQSSSQEVTGARMCTAWLRVLASGQDRTKRTEFARHAIDTSGQWADEIMARTKRADERAQYYSNIAAVVAAITTAAAAAAAATDADGAIIPTSCWLQRRVCELAVDRCQPSANSRRTRDDVRTSVVHNVRRTFVKWIVPGSAIGTLTRVTSMASFCSSHDSAK